MDLLLSCDFYKNQLYISTFIASWLPSRVSWYGAYLFKAFPLDMSQFPNLFNSTRIPCYGKDELTHDESARHVIVMRNGNFFVFDILDKHGKSCTTFAAKNYLITYE